MHSDLLQPRPEGRRVCVQAPPGRLPTSLETWRHLGYSEPELREGRISEAPESSSKQKRIKQYAGRTRRATLQGRVNLMQLCSGTCPSPCRGGTGLTTATPLDLACLAFPVTVKTVYTLEAAGRTISGCCMITIQWIAFYFLFFYYYYFHFI